MAKIKVGDLRELLKINTDIETHEFKGLDIEIKQYLPMLEKISLVSSIYESAVNTDNGLHIVGGNELDIAFKNLFIQFYTNVTLPKNTMDAYNLLVSTGIFNFVYRNLPEDERIDLEMALENHIAKKQEIYEQENTIQYIIKELLSGLIGKLPSLEEAQEFIENASKEIEGFDPSKLKFVEDFMKFDRGEDVGDSNDI